MADGICRTSRQKRRKQQQILPDKVPKITRRKRSKRIRLQRAPWGAEADKKAVFEINSIKDQQNPGNPSKVFSNLNGEDSEQRGAQVEVTVNNIECQRSFDMVGRRFQAVKNKASELSHMYYNGVMDNGTRSVYGPYAHNSQEFEVVLDCEVENVGRQDMELANRTEEISVPCSVIESGEDPQLTRRVSVFLVDDEDERDGVCQGGVAGKRARKRVEGLRCRKEFGELDQYLDTHIIDRYMEQIWKDLPKSKKDHCTYLDCLWFSMYLEELTSFKILKWIKAKRIFSKRYVFIPIVHWGHWNLLILCHFGDDLRSRSRTPCMLLLDSLKETDPSRLEPLIRNVKFLTFSGSSWKFTREKEGRTARKLFQGSLFWFLKFHSRQMVMIVAYSCSISLISFYNKLQIISALQKIVILIFSPRTGLSSVISECAASKLMLYF